MDLSGGPGFYCNDYTPDEEEDIEEMCGDEGGEYDFESCQCNWPGGDGGSGGGGGGAFNPSDNTPIITGISPGIWPSGTSTAVTLSGEFFGTNPPTLTFSDATISYQIYSSSDTQIQLSVNVPSGTPNENIYVTVTSNGYGVYGFYSSTGVSPTSAGVYATVQTPLTTPEVTVIAWVNGQAQDVLNTVSAGPSTALLATHLNQSASSCAAEIAAWGVLQNPIDINTAQDSAYVNAWMINHSGNPQPPSNIQNNVAQQRIAGNYRLFNDFGAAQGSYQVGITPSPCGDVAPALLQNWLGNAQSSPYMGASSFSPSGETYLLAEGRVGTVGQSVNATVNGLSTPWIWSVIEFDPSGNPTAKNHAIFPTYSIYINGILQEIDPQSALATFAALDGSYQLTPSQIQ